MKKLNIKLGNGWFSLALTLVFITLKLTDQIDWSWGWVLAPLWMVWVLAIAVVVLFALLTLIFG